MGEGWRRTKRTTSAAFRPVRGRDLFHVIVLAGYSATLALSRRRAARVAGRGPAESRMP